MITLNNKDRSKEKYFSQYQIENSKVDWREYQIIDHSDLKWFWSYLNSKREVDEVLNYLKKNNLKIHTETISKGNYSFYVKLEGRELSGNGCGFSGTVLLNHVRNYRSYKAVLDSDSFKLYRQMKEKYMKVEDFFDIYHSHIYEYKRAQEKNINKYGK